MKTITTISNVSLTYADLMKCHSVGTNRCGYLNKETALQNGFSELDWDKFIKRAKKLCKTIQKDGFSRASFFVLAKDFDGNIHLLDGQRRRMALKMLNEEEHFDFSTWEFVGILFNDPMTKKEMGQLVIELNTGNTNWQTKDIRRSNAISADDEEVRIAYQYAKDFQDKYELGDYVANLFVFGEKASHQRATKTDPFSTRDYSPYKDVFMEAYAKFVENASYGKDKNGNDIERSSVVKKAIRNSNFAISFNSCLRSIVKYNDGNVEKAKDDIMYFVDRLLDSCNGDDAYVKQFVKCAKKDKEIVADKARHGSRMRRSVLLALYGKVA